MYIKYLFISFALILALMIMFFKIYVQKLPRSEKISGYVSVITWAFALYVLSAFILAFVIQGNINKFVILFFAVSPFIIGKFATYEKESFYSFIQICCAILSAWYVYFV